MFICIVARLRGAARCAAVAIACGTPVALLPGPAQGADLAPAPPDLRSAVADAWTRHPESVAVQATIDAASARADAASRPLYNPELELNADDEGPDRSATAAVGLTLDLSGKRKARTAAATAELDTAAAVARLKRQEFARTWIEAWAATAAAEHRVTLGRQRIELLTRSADLAERQFTAGDISSLDRDLAMLTRDEAAAAQASLLADLATARAAFQSVAAGSAAPAQVTVSAPASAAPESGALASVEALPEWTVAQSSLATAQAQVTVAERNRVADPTLTLRGGSIELADGARDNLYGISVSVPLFVRNSYGAELAAAKADARAATADLERLRYQLEARAERASATYRAVLEAWQQWRKSPATDVQARADLLERLWRAGEMSTADYLLQLNQTVDTALAGAELEGRLWVSFTDYLVATGRLEQWLGLDASMGG